MGSTQPPRAHPEGEREPLPTRGHEGSGSSADAAFGGALGTSPAPRRRRWTRVTLGIVGLALIVLLCLGGCMVALKVGLDEMTSEIESVLGSNPALIEEVGTVQTFALDLGGTFTAEDPDEYVFVVEGTRGRGSVRALYSTDELRSAVLELAGGRRVELVPE